METFEKWSVATEWNRHNKFPVFFYVLDKLLGWNISHISNLEREILFWHKIIFKETFIIIISSGKCSYINGFIIINVSTNNVIT